MWQCEARLLYEANRRALGTKDMVTFFFFQFLSSLIVWFLAIKQNLSEPKLNLLFLLSGSRRIRKEGRVKRLLPTVPKWTNNEQESRPIYRSTICRLTTDISKGYFLTTDQVSTDHRPSVDQLLTDTSVKYRPTIGEVSVKYRWTKSYVGRDISRATIERASTVSRPSVDRLSTDYRPTSTAISTDYRPRYRPSVDRLSTAISTDRSVDTTYSKQDPNNIGLIVNIINRKVF